MPHFVNKGISGDYGLWRIEEASGSESKGRAGELFGLVVPLSAFRADRLLTASGHPESCLLLSHPMVEWLSN